jgi:hypothetical protein
MFWADKTLMVQAQDPILESGPAQIPGWAKQGTFRFTRLDA